MKRRMNGYLLAGLIVTGLMAALILVGLVWTPYDPDALLAGPKLEGPSLAHWLGTDSFGRDIFSRVLQGAGTTFLIALSTVAIGAVCGTAAGALTGYFGGVGDDLHSFPTRRSSDLSCWPWFSSASWGRGINTTW